MDNSLKTKTIKGIAWKFSERIFAQLVSLIVSIILARLLMPDDYAVIGIVAIFFTFSNVIISGGLNTALVQKKNADQVDYSSIFYLTLFISIALYLVLFFLAPFISSLYSNEILTPVFRVMGLILIINAVKSILCAYVSSRLDFKSFFWATFIGTLLSAVIGIVLAILGAGVWALVAQQMINALFDTVFLFFVTKFRPIPIISFDRIKILFRYGWKIFLSSIINELYNEINPLVIGIKYSGTDLAYYSKGRSFPKLINSSVNDTLQAVLFPAMSKVQDNKEMLLKFTRRFIRVSSFVIMPMMLGFLAVSDNFISVVLTEKWMPASIYIKIFCVVYLFEIIQTGNLQVIKAMGRSDLTLILGIIKKTLYFSVIICFIIFTDSPVFLAIGSIVNILIATIINTIPNRKLIGYSYYYQLSDILMNLITSLIMAFSVYLIGYIPINKIVLLIIQVLSGGLIYLLIAFLTKNKALAYITNTAKEFFRKRRND